MKLFSGIKRKEIFNLGLFAVSLVPVLLLIFVVAQRIGTPFALEWGEGAGINQIYRILAGEQLYAEPSLEFAALVYTPLYYWMAAVLSTIGDQVILTARLLSFLAAMGTMGIIWWIVFRETGKPLMGWFASALYAGCFALSDGFYDLIRVDSFTIFLLLVSFGLLRFCQKPSGMVIAGFTIALSIFSKQSSLIVFTPLVLYILLGQWKKAWPVLPALILGVGLPLFILNTSSGGWFSYYILRLPQEHGYSVVSAANFWVSDVLSPLGIAVGFGLLYCLLWLVDKPENTQKTGKKMGNKAEQSAIRAEAEGGGLYHILFAAGAIGAAWITRASNGGGANNAMSAYAAIALLFGLGVDQAYVLIGRGGKDREIYSLLLPAILAIQFIGLLYNPFNFIPTEIEVSASEVLMDQISSMEDPPFIPYRSELSVLAGKTIQVHAVNLFEFIGYFKGDVLPMGQELVEGIKEKLCYQSYGLVMLDQPIPWVSDQLTAAYRPDDTFSFFKDERRSEVLDWQGGYQAFYLPLAEYDLNSCLETVAIQDDK